MKWIIGCACLPQPAARPRAEAAPRRCSPATRRSASPSRARSTPSPARPRTRLRRETATLTLAGTGRNPSDPPLRARHHAGGCRRPASFPPLRVEFAQPPAATSLFAGQRRLKLVTHCRSPGGVPAAFAARIFRLSHVQPDDARRAYRARLATVDYAEPSGKVSTTPLGLLHRGSGRRRQAQRPDRGAGRRPHPVGPAGAARRRRSVALFEYMIGNLDWSMRAGPAGRGLLPQRQADQRRRRGARARCPMTSIIRAWSTRPMPSRPRASRSAASEVASIGAIAASMRQALAAAADFRARRAGDRGGVRPDPGHVRTDPEQGAGLSRRLLRGDRDRRNGAQPRSSRTAVG